ncbi:hypothetical protein ACIO52_02690 [Nocardia sp. NPDC087230]|uniref:hypothetical protein n=1 Tax=Nocardia sp. NPDC087230 TaxID=3364331 RepID=UPI00382A0C27
MTDSPLDLRRYTAPATDDDDRFDDRFDDRQQSDDRWGADDDVGWVGDWSDWSQPSDRTGDHDKPAASPGFRQVGRNFPGARSERGPGRVIAELAAAFGVILLGLVVVLAVLPDTEQPSADPTETLLPAPLTVPAVAPTTAPEHAITDCPHTRTTALASGADAGDTTSAVSVIFAVQHAYYVDRSGTKAREFVTADAKVPPAEEIQAGIDTVPVGTRYCVSIVPTSPARWQVHVREQRPGQLPELLATLIIHTATEPDGTSKITAISEGP